MKKLATSLIMGILALAVLTLASPALAGAPSLSVASQGGDNVLITVSGANSNNSITLYRRQTTMLWTAIGNFGQTDGSGYFSQATSLSSDGSNNPVEQYVMVGGWQSNTVRTYPNGGSGCGYSGCGANVGFSQNNLNLNVGQSATVTVSGGNSFYISSNPNPGSVSASLSGNVINLYAVNSGASTIVVCGGSSACGNLFVNVGGGSGGGLSLSQTNVNLTVGQTVVVTANGVFGNSLYISGNTNPGIANVTVSGNQINFYGLMNGIGSVTVCISGAAQCSNISVTVSGSVLGGSAYQVYIRDNYFSPNNIIVPVGSTVTWTNNGGMAHTVTADNGQFNSGALNPGGSFVQVFNAPGTYAYHCSFHSGMTGTIVVTGNSGGSGLTFGQNNLNLTLGQTVQDSIFSNQTGAFYISSQSNPNTVVASINGSQLTLLGQNLGSGNISVCQGVSGLCGSVSVTVGNATGSGQVWFSQSNPTLNFGQSLALTIYSSNYSAGYYISSNSNTNAVLANVVGNTLNLTGNNVSGSSVISVCQSNGGNCGSLTVYTNPSYAGSVSLSQNSLNLNLGQSSAITIYGSTYPAYFVSSNSNPGVASASVAASSLTIYANSAGSATISVCAAGSSNCASLYVTVSGFTSDSLYFQTASLPQPVVGTYYSQQLQASGGNQSYNFVLQSGQLPAGLSLSSGGLIYGTPQNNQTANFSVRVQDSAGKSAASSFTLTPSGGYTPPPLPLPPPPVLGASVYASGQLISENRTVYIVYKASKTGFISAAAFLGLGFKFGNVLEVGYSGLADSGYNVQTARASHPWGSWIKAGHTVYFVHESGLIPVPDWATFINNGGDGRLVVLANPYDSSLPILPVMEFSDIRLR